MSSVPRSTSMGCVGTGTLSRRLPSRSRRRCGNESLETVVPADRIRATALEEGAVAPAAPWLVEFWAKGRTRGWYLSQLPFLHVYGHYFEAQAVRGLWGHPSR